MLSPTQYQGKKYLYDLEAMGWGAIFYGLVGGIPTTIIFIHKVYLESEINGANLYILSYSIAFIGLAITGIFIVIKWRRYILLFFLPLSIVGLAAVPFGTCFYCRSLWIFWIFKHLFFPFDIIYSGKKGAGVDSKV